MLSFYITVLVTLSSVVLASKPLRMVEIRARRNTISGPDLFQDAQNFALSTSLTNVYPAHHISVPIDHFHNDTLYVPHTNDTFRLRYFFDASYYKPGGPVIVLQGGEFTAEGRLPFLQQGILHKLIVATHGIGVVLEHRYYGTSIPTPDFSTENLRFLTTDQALADQAYFAKNVQFPGLEHLNLTSPNVPYVAYGGSYAGGFVAFLRKLYPDVYWGAISSSGVTEAIYDFWAYWEPIRIYAPAKCISLTQKITDAIDKILLKKDAKRTLKLKKAWGLPNVTHDDDFAAVLSLGVEGWQGRNWDPAINSPYFEFYCGNITSDKLLKPFEVETITDVQELIREGGYNSEIDSLQTALLNWIAWTQQNFVSRCDTDQDICFGSHDSSFYHRDDIYQDWRAWPYQYCTQWGYLQRTHTPETSILPVTSRLLDLNYHARICRQAFNITVPPNTTAINKYGGFNISYLRLAIIDGEQDPWRPATPHASPFDYYGAVGNRTGGTAEPWLLMKGAVHHWDENGLDDEDRKKAPKEVAHVQEEEVRFVQEWLKQWHFERIQDGDRLEL